MPSLKTYQPSWMKVQSTPDVRLLIASCKYTPSSSHVINDDNASVCAFTLKQPALDLQAMIHRVKVPCFSLMVNDIRGLPANR